MKNKVLYDKKLFLMIVFIVIIISLLIVLIKKYSNFAKYITTYDILQKI